MSDAPPGTTAPPQTSSRLRGQTSSRTRAAAPGAPAAPSGIAAYINRDTFPKLWILICKLWLIVSVGALVMNLVVWLMVIGQNLNEFKNQEGHYLGNDLETYGGDPDNGYVDKTNIPKHLGGAIFAAAFDVSMMIIIVIAMCADVFWKFTIVRNVLEMFFAVGLYEGEGKRSSEIEYFFLIANAFLKIFICAATGAETFTGLRPNQPNVDTALFCLYAVFILLGSIPLTVIASMFVIQRNKAEAYRAKH